MMSLSKIVAALLAPLPTSAPAQPQRIYACGDDQVRQYDVSGDSAVEVWRWSAAQAEDLPAAYRTTLLAHVDDCKPVDGGRAILVTASTGGVVLIDRATGRTRFRATAPMAHSADLLPGGYVAVALSIHANGDRLQLYSVADSEHPLAALSLPSGHGAVWDARRMRLFTLSHDLVQAFAFDPHAAGPRLTETARWTLPGRHDGHDLSRTPAGDYTVTTDDGLWSFDPERGRFAAVAALNPALRVKAVSVAPGGMAWVQAEESWWAHGFTIAHRTGKTRRIETPGLKLYKVRWAL